MQREMLSRRSVLAIATGCTVAGVGATTVGGVLEDGEADADTAEEDLARDSFSIRAGTEQETTVYVTEAPVDGPTVVVVGGMHGNEVAGYEAAGEIADWRIDAGTLVAIPEANAVAIEQGTRSGDDWTDLNRQFPEGETPETELARAIWNVIVDYDADAVVDLHESTGIYAGDPVDGVGQAIFHSGGEAVETAEETVEYVNERYVDDPDLAFETGPFSGPNTEPSGLLVHKAARDLGAEAYLVETLSTDVDLETRVRWHLAITERLVADDLFPEDEPDNGHDPDVDEDAEENDEDEDAAEDEPGEDASDDADEDGDDENAADDASPIAKIKSDPANAAEAALESGQTVTLDATCSEARDGRIVCYAWDVGETGQFDDTGETLQVTVGDGGRDTVVLRVKDDAGRTATESITVSTE